MHIKTCFRIEYFEYENITYFLVSEMQSSFDLSKLFTMIVDKISITFVVDANQNTPLGLIFTVST